MGAEIDRLEVVVVTQASKADQKLDSLVKKLEKLSSSVEKLNTGRIKEFSRSFNTLSAAMKGLNTNGLSSTVSAINRLSKLDSGNMTNVSKSIDVLRASIGRMSGIQVPDFGSLDKLVSNISKFNTKRMASAAQNLPQITREFSNFVSQMNSIGSITFDMSGMSNLISSITKLGGKASTQAVTNLKPLKDQMLRFVSGLNGIGSVNFDVSGLYNLISSISKLGSKKIGQAIPNIQQLSVALKDMMSKLSNAPSVSSNLIKMTNAMANLASQGAKVRSAANAVNSVGDSAGASGNKTQYFSNSLSLLGAHTGIADGKMKRFTTALSNYISKSVLATKKTRSLSQVWGSLCASFFPIIRGMKALGRSVESSMDYIETFNYFNVTMDKIGKEFSSQYSKYGYDSAGAYADSFSSRLNDLTKKMTGYEVGKDGVLSLSGSMNLGLDPNQMMNYQASVAAITNSVGLVGETSVNTAKALSMLAADMSSFKNVDLKTVMTNMQSGLIGQSRALYKYGIDITNATLQTYAYKYGLSTAVSEMTQADKMQLRLLAILDQSKIAWGDQANTINSVANQYRILKQQISNVARMIGNILMPVVQAVLPFINGLLIATQRLLGFVGGLLGIDFSKIMDGISSGYSGTDLGDLVDDTGDTAGNLDKASKNAKKLQRTLLGFDQINKLNDDSDSSKSSDGGAGGIDLSGAIADALADYEAVWNEAFEKSVNDAQKYADKICAVFSRMWGMIKKQDYEGLGKYIAGGVNQIFEKINSTFNWDKMGPGITKFVDGYTRTLNSLATNIHWADIGKTLGDGLNVITNTLYLYFSGIDWINIGASLATGLNGMINSVDWGILGRTIGAWIMMIPSMVYGFVTTLNWGELGAGIGNSLNGALMEFDGTTIAGGINGIVHGIIDALSAFIRTVDWSEVAKAVGDVLGNLDWGALAKVGLALAAVKLTGALGNLFGSALSEKIKKIFGGMLDNAFKGIGTKLGALKSGISGLFADGAIFGGISTGGLLAIGSAIAVVIAGIVDLWKTSETFRDNVTNMLSIIGGAFQLAKQMIWDEGLKPLWDSIKEFFGSLYEIYESSGLKDIFEGVVTAIGYVASIALGGLILAIGEFVQFLVNIVQKVVDVLNVVLDFVKDFFESHKETIDGLKQMYHGLTEFLAGIFSGDWSRAWDGIKEIFSGVWNSLVSIVKKPINGVLEMCEKLANGVITAFNAIKKVLNKLSFDIPDWVPEFGGESFGFDFEMTPKIKIPRFEGGGFPNTGEMFLARENGLTEMVGRIGSHPAVANNDQITQGIASSVYPAVYDAVTDGMVAVMMGANENQGQAPVIEVTLKCDSETLYKTVQKGKVKSDRRYSVVVPVN